MLKALVNLDYLLIKDYLSRARLVKLFVVANFLLVFVGVYVGILLICLTFFYNLAGYELIGQLTVNYILNTGIIVLFWLGIGSSIVAFLNQVINPKPETLYLLTLPIPPKYLLLWSQLKQLILGSFIVYLFLSPVQFAYEAIFLEQIFWLIQLKVIIFSLAIVSLSQAIGLSLGGLVAPFIRRLNMFVVTLITIFSFVVSAIVTISLLLPKSMRTLYQSQPEDFLNIYNQLPLNYSFSPSRIVANNLIVGLDLWGLLILLIAGIALVASFLQYHKIYLDLIQLLQIKTNRPQQERFLTLTPRTKLPLTYNWSLQILRDGKELSSLVFFLLLSLLFFVLLGRSQFIREFETVWSAELMLVSLVWLLFMVTAYSLRIVFPLASKISSSAWLLATTPNSSNYRFINLILTSLILISPLMILGFLVWFSLPLPTIWSWIGAYLSGLATLAIVLINLFLGCINPDFEHNSQPDVISTSGPGLVSLGWSLLLVGTSAALVYLGIKTNFELATGLILATLVCWVSVLTLSIIARYRFAKYQY